MEVTDSHMTTFLIIGGFQMWGIICLIVAGVMYTRNPPDMLKYSGDTNSLQDEDLNKMSDGDNNIKQHIDITHM